MNNALGHCFAMVLVMVMRIMSDLQMQLFHFFFSSELTLAMRGGRVDEVEGHFPPWGLR
jgi:hypothetical protein